MLCISAKSTAESSRVPVGCVEQHMETDVIHGSQDLIAKLATPSALLTKLQFHTRSIQAMTCTHTIVTESMTKYRHAYGYAGIPKYSEQCVTDLSDHQVLHLVSHDMCRFCRFETRPLQIKDACKSSKRFIKAEKLVNFSDKSTCSVCLLEAKYKTTCMIHENKNIDQKFKCEDCPKSFVSQSSLNHHLRKHQSPETVRYHLCDHCNKTSWG